MRKDERQLKLGLTAAGPKGSTGEAQRGRLLRTVGLFAGIGGLERGLGLSGHETTLLCENDPAANRVLDTHFTDIRRHGDIRSLDGLPTGTELLVGGFPCQDLSQAGPTNGIFGARSGLVSEVFRLLERTPVPWVLLENVPFMLQLGRGRAMEVIIDALERLGYRWAYRTVDTRSFGLPQRRRRVFLLATLETDPRGVLMADATDPPAEPDDYRSVACGFYWTEGIRGLGWAVNAIPTLKNGSTIGIPSPPAIILPSGSIVKPDIRDAERLQGFPADWTAPAESIVPKSARWRLVGNAVSVPVATWLGRRLASAGTPLEAEEYPAIGGRSWPAAAYNVDKNRVAVAMSEYPLAVPCPSLRDFLEFEPTPLTLRAAAGFLERAKTGSLRFPPGFLDAVARHVTNMANKDNSASRGRAMVNAPAVRCA
ncbi:MAG: DNA (cytosine-5-)-methyltransferase [Gammaproteobacteria bacterium]|nr:DNA (cytosine-5-)-methyltransferase [Gammaproteobacteria bacterium]